MIEVNTEPSPWGKSSPGLTGDTSARIVWSALEVLMTQQEDPQWGK